MGLEKLDILDFRELKNKVEKIQGSGVAFASSPFLSLFSFVHFFSESMGGGGRVLVLIPGSTKHYLHVTYNVRQTR